MLLNPQFKKNSIPGHISPCTVYLPMAAIGRLDRKLDSLSLESKKKTMLAAAEKGLPIDSLGQITDNSLDEREVKSTPAPTRYHTIRKGETLSSIAKKNGVSLNSLMKANGIKSKNKNLQIGQKLAIPSKEKAKSSKKKTKKTKTKKRRR